MLYIAMLILGIAAGLRAVTPLAAIAWGAYFGWIDLSGGWATFLANLVAPVVLSLFALLEYVGDQLPTTPSRKTVPAFAGRIVTGGASGMLLGLSADAWFVGLVLGVAGAVIGTLGGYEARMRLARAFGRDRPAALLEDGVAIVLALLAVYFA